MGRNLLLFIGCFQVLIAPALAFGCAAFFQPTITGQGAAVNAQKVLYVVRDKSVELHAQIAVDAADGEFAWVIPVPDVESVDLGNAKVFESLGITNPKISFYTASDSGGGGGIQCGCGAAAKDGAAAGGRGFSNTVDHFGGGKLGDYTYDVLASKSAADMVDWLKDNGYSTPDGAVDVLQPYADAGMKFVWAKVNPDAAKGSVSTDPLKITIPIADPAKMALAYPLALSKLSAAPINPVVLFVLAGQRFHVAGIDNLTLEDVGVETRKRVDDGLDYEYAAVIDAMTADSDGNLAITEYAQDVSTMESDLAFLELVDDSATYLTRLFLRAPESGLTDLSLMPLHNVGDVTNDVVARAEPPAPLYQVLAGNGLVILMFIGLLMSLRCREPGKAPLQRH